mgnify:CR=1 FL=1|tara:strand:+ start:362 stop:589 length:228 start_codon:yes stop_codon:yes gene_type:complete
MKEAGITISNNYLKEPFPNPTKAEQVDLYLSRIVDAFSTEISKGARIDFVRSDTYWSAENLPGARGQHLLTVNLD